MSHTDDHKLIQDAKRGKTDAFGELYERYEATIYRYISSHVGNRYDAEDMTEEVFIRAWNALPNYDERGLPFSTFLFRSARNSIIDYYRTRKDVQSLGDYDIRSEFDNPEEEINNKIENESLKAKLSLLREDYRSVLSLRFLSGLSTEETSAIMDRSAGAIRILQHRALTALKAIIERGEHEQPW